MQIWIYMFSMFSFRYEVALGTAESSTSIKNWKNVGYVNLTIFTSLAIPAGTVIHASIRGYNGAELHNISVSNYVVVSPLPTVNVLDGLKTATDSKYLGDLGLMSSQWTFGDKCPLVEAFWEVQRIDGTIIMAKTNIDIRNETLYTDTVKLVEGLSYINIVTTVDILNRTAIGKSNGVTIGIIKPDPGEVRDGSIVQGEDFKYQELARRYL